MRPDGAVIAVAGLDRFEGDGEYRPCVRERKVDRPERERPEEGRVEAHAHRLVQVDAVGDEFAERG